LSATEMDSGDQGLFWGVILKPEKRYEQTVEEDFRITKACVDPSTLDKGKVASVILEKDNDEFIICNLTSPNGLDVPMDLAFAVGEKVVFRTEGGATVHLTGHVQPADDMPGYPGGYEMDSDDEVVEEEGEEEESSDDEEEEETPPKLVKKRKLENGGTAGEGQKSAKKQKGEAVKQAEAMKKILSKEKPQVDDEDDSDDDDDMYEDMEEAEDDSESEEEEESSPEQVTPKAKKDKKQKEAQQSSPTKNGQTPKKDGKKAEKVKGAAEQATPAKADAQAAPETPKSKKKKNKKDGQEQQAKTPGSKDQAKTPGKDQAKTPAKEGKTPKKTLKGGIQVEDIRVGNGPEAKAGKMVGMYYDGKLTQSGKRFDACKQGKPFKFKLGKGEVIKGWDLGVEGMKVGGKRRLVIPAQMGYGSQGALPDIPPNASLTFEVECKTVN